MAEDEQNILNENESQNLEKSDGGDAAELGAPKAKKEKKSKKAENAEERQESGGGKDKKRKKSKDEPQAQPDARGLISNYEADIKQKKKKKIITVICASVFIVLVGLAIMLAHMFTTRELRESRKVVDIKIDSGLKEAYVEGEEIDFSQVTIRILYDDSTVEFKSLNENILISPYTIDMKFKTKILVPGADSDTFEVRIEYKEYVFTKTFIVTKASP
ncbi:MAG: hypothetical protein ACOYIN_02245 [Christensenellales bacterium]|jgi:flagellar basal body-associated protein FliL|nr:hypothetical protein [Clostridia bacterium]HRU84388.1 hypothetical protein [Eubacteriales bacterium]